MRAMIVSIMSALILAAPYVGGQVCDLGEIDSVSVSGNLSTPLVFGEIAYAAAGSSGIAMVSVEDPAELTALGVMATHGEATDLALDYFPQLLVVADGLAGVGVYTIDGDGSLTEVGTTDLDEVISAVAGSSGRFIAGGMDGTLFAISVFSEQAPELSGSVELPGPVMDLVVQSHTVFCALGEGGVAMVSTDDPASPEVVDILDLGGSVLSVERLGDLLYCGVEGVGLVAVSVSSHQLSIAGSLALAEAPTAATAWSGRIYLAAPGNGVSEADVTLPGDPLLLTELELDGADGLALVNDTLFVSRGTAGFSAVDVSDCANAGVDPTTSYVPAAAKAEGGFNSSWLTDAAFANLTNATASFNISYIVKAQENLQPMSVSMVLEPGEQLFVQDVFSTMFGLPAANGALRIVTSHPNVKITTRTYNIAGEEGTYGQYIPAFTRDAALAPDKVGALLQLQENPGFRSNLGLMNLKLEPVDVEIQLYRGSGELVGVINETLEAAEMTQLDRIYTLVGAGRVDNGYALVTVLTDGGQVIAYASVADKGSNDAIFIGAQILTPGTPFVP